jgi:hypothetical protein
MKKIFASILALTMLVCCLSISAFAADAPTWTIDDFTAKAGDSLTINVNISGVPSTGISSGKLEIKCDGFTITRIRNGSWMDGENSAVHNPDAGLANYANIENNTEPSGQFVRLEITVKSDAAPGQYPITITSSDIQVSTGPDSFNALTGGTTTATLTIEGSSEPPVPQDPTYSVTAGAAEYTKGSDKGVDFTVTADPADAPINITGVEVDGTAVPADQLTIDGGKVTVAPAYLDTLGDGNHTVKVNMDNGSAETAINVKPAAVEPPEDPCANGHDWGEWTVIKEATATEDGLERRVCKNNPEHIEERAIPATGEQPVETKYEVEFDDADWTKGSGKDLGVTVYTDPHKDEVTINDVKIDGNSIVPDGAHIDDNGKLFIDAAALEALDAGNHTITFEIDDATVEKTLEVKAAQGGEQPGDQPGAKPTDKPDDTKPGQKDDAAKTGDLTNLYIYIAICLFAAAAIVGTSYEVKKNRG